MTNLPQDWAFLLQMSVEELDNLLYSEYNWSFRHDQQHTLTSRLLLHRWLSSDQCYTAVCNVLATSTKCASCACVVLGYWVQSTSLIFCTCNVNVSDQAWSGLVESWGLWAWNMQSVSGQLTAGRGVMVQVLQSADATTTGSRSLQQVSIIWKITCHSHESWAY